MKNTRELNRNKISALVVEQLEPGLWIVVNMTELTKDGVWRCGENMITSLESVVEKANRLGVPIMTRRCLENFGKTIHIGLSIGVSPYDPTTSAQ